MEITEKREDIATCIVGLKRGLKKIRRQDIDAAIKLLLMYDHDLKRIAKLPARPVERHYVEQEATVPHNNDQVMSIVINDDNGSWAYPMNTTVEKTVAMVMSGDLKPMAKVQVDQWMKEHRRDEIAFMNVFATVVSGRIVVRQEDIIVIGAEVILNNDVTQKYRVKGHSKGKVYLDRGLLMSLIPVKESNVSPVKKTEVKYFIVDKWEQ